MWYLLIILTYYFSRLDESSVEKSVARRQLSIKAYGENSWFVDIRKLCVKYSLPDPYTVLDCPPSKGQWKSVVHKAVYVYWVDNLKWRASFYSSLEFLCVSGYWSGKKHPLIHNIGCVSDVPRVHTKLKLVTGTYIRQVNRVRFNQNEIDATWQICHQAEETLEHFILDCTVLEPVRRPALDAILRIAYDLLDGPLERYQLLQLILDSSFFFSGSDATLCQT